MKPGYVKYQKIEADGVTKAVAVAVHRLNLLNGYQCTDEDEVWLDDEAADVLSKEANGMGWGTWPYAQMLVRVKGVPPGYVAIACAGPVYDGQPVYMVGSVEESKDAALYKGLR